MSKPMARADGFTLIEVLVAVAIAAAIAVMAYNGLSAAITAADRHQAQVEALAELQSAMSLIERDLRQLSERGIVNEYGLEEEAFRGGKFNDALLQFTRGGWDNPLDQRRGTLQRVQYVLEDEVLWREHWPVLDRIDSTPKQRVRLLEGVIDIDLQFLNKLSTARDDIGGEWIEQWPGRATSEPFPSALDLTLELEKWGRIRRVFQFPG